VPADKIRGGAPDGAATERRGGTMEDKPRRWRDSLVCWATIALGLVVLLLIQERSSSLFQIVVSGVVLGAVYLVGRYRALL